MGTLAVVSSLVKITEEHYAHFSPHYATQRAFQFLQGRNQQGAKISLDSLYVQVVAIERDKVARPAGLEPAAFGSGVQFKLF